MAKRHVALGAAKKDFLTLRKVLVEQVPGTVKIIDRYIRALRAAHRQEVTFYQHSLDSLTEDRDTNWQHKPGWDR